MREEPFFSVIIPAYNASGHISRCIESVVRQTYTRYEIIVCDDGSSDDTVKILGTLAGRNPQVNMRIICVGRQGPGAARNRAIAEARYDWLAFLDADDAWEPGKLERVAAYITGHPQADIICHNELWECGTVDRLVRYQESFDRSVHPFLSLYRRNALSTSAVVARLSCIRKAGLFDEGLASAQDYDVWLRVALTEGITIAYLDEPLGRYISRTGNISSNVEKRLVCKLRINEKYREALRKVAWCAYGEEAKFVWRSALTACFTLMARRRFVRAMKCLLLAFSVIPLRSDYLHERIASRMG